MEIKKLFEEIAERINAEVAAGNKRMTILCMSDFGAPAILYINAESAEYSGYAQYRDGLRLTFTKRGGRTKCAARFYGDLHYVKPFAIFRGWVAFQENMPKSWTCFDRSLFYRFLESADHPEAKIGEVTERLFSAERLAKEKVYHFITCTKENGWSTEIYEAAAEIPHEVTGKLNSRAVCVELNGEPTFSGFCGPMYDGEDERGRVIVRYESREAYDILSA